MKFRHEIKHDITYEDMLILRSRLQPIMRTDPNGENGLYEIRSLYFDNLYDTALREKIDGVNEREKFRIRLYNGNTDFIRLEKKSKINGLCSKADCTITAEEAAKIAAGDTDFLGQSRQPLMRELHVKMQMRGIRPKTLVDYTREAFIYPAGNVRITMDSHVRTGLLCTDFLNPDCVTVPVNEDYAILEVKWDEYFPDMIRDLIQLPGRRCSAFSKYAACRIYG